MDTIMKELQALRLEMESLKKEFELNLLQRDRLMDQMGITFFDLSIMGKNPSPIDKDVKPAGLSTSVSKTIQHQRHRTKWM